MEPVSEYQENTNKPHTSDILFKDVGFLFTGGLAGIILFVIILFLLNFFNILPLSSLFPNQLGWLPHQKQDSKISYNNIVPKQQNTDISTSSAKFSYDPVKAQKTLEKYIIDNIKEDFLPSKIDVKQGLLSSGQTDGTPYEFGTNWEMENISFNATFHYIENSNELRDTEFYINPKEYKNTSLDTSISATLVKTYLKNIPESLNFDCGTSSSAKFCERFVTEEAGKSGFGIVSVIDKFGKNNTFIFSCFIPKNDSYYNKRTSCLLFREKDSIGL